MNKKGVSAKIGVLIGALIFLILVVALAPTFFNGLSNISGAPSWLNVALPVIVGAGLLIAVYKAFS
jgi:hypothetical protein